MCGAPRVQEDMDSVSARLPWLGMRLLDQFRVKIPISLSVFHPVIFVILSNNFLFKMQIKPFIALFLLFLFGSTQAQDEKSDKSFFASLSAGTGFNSPINYPFRGDTQFTFINPGVYSGVALGYGPYEILDLTELFWGISASYTKVSTSETKLAYYNDVKAKLIIETIPILIWVKLQTNTKLSPFIEAGIGYSRLNFLERYTGRHSDISFNYWALGYKSGAGLSYRYSNDIAFESGIYSFTVEKEYVVRDGRNQRAGIFVRNVVFVYELRLNIKL